MQAKAISRPVHAMQVTAQLRFTKARGVQAIRWRESLPAMAGRSPEAAAEGRQTRGCRDQHDSRHVHAGIAAGTCLVRSGDACMPARA